MDILRLVRTAWRWLGHISTAMWLGSLGGGAVSAAILRAFAQLSWPWVVTAATGIGALILAAFLGHGRKGQPRLHFGNPVVPTHLVAVYAEKQPYVSGIISNWQTAGTASAESTTILDPTGWEKGEEFYIAHLPVMNEQGSPVDAENVAVLLEFPGREGFHARWVDLNQQALFPNFGSYSEAEQLPRLRPGDQSSVDVAAKHPQDVRGYAYGNKTADRWHFAGRLDVRHGPYELAGATVMVRATIIASANGRPMKPVQESFCLFNLDREGQPGFRRPEG